MAKPTKIGVIGLGAIGNVHLNAFQAAGDEAQIAAVCDLDETRVKATADKFGVAGRFKNHKDLLKSDVDAVLICMWNHLHCDLACEALKAGKHVLLEKPMAMNSKESQQIIAAAKRAKRVLQIGMVNRQEPEVQLVRKYVTDGLLGEIYHIRLNWTRRRGIPGLGGWFTTKHHSGGGPMIDLGVHWFDLGMYMSGLWKPTSVSAATYAKFGKNIKKYCYVGMWAGPPKFDGVCDVEDYATGFVRFGKQATMDFNFSWAANAEDATSIEILGSKGGVRLMDGKPLRLYTEFNGNLVDIAPKIKEEDRFARQAKSFLAACRGECPPIATGTEGLAVMKLIDGVYQSGRLQKEIVLRNPSVL